MPFQKRIFQKPSLNLQQQIDLLQKKGLDISNPDRTLHYLRFIGYYRLSGYFQPFQDSSGIFKDNASFDQVLNVYIFDRQLRLLVMDAVERVEVAVRTTISNSMSEQHGAHWYLNGNLFVKKYNHQQLLQIVRQATGYNNPNSQTKFNHHYFQNYHKPDLPPSWMIAEVLSIGTWSNIFHNLQSRELQKQISKPYGLHYTVMASWLHSFTYLRNLCAHHSRLWNRIFIIKPKALKKHQKHFANNSRFSSQAAVLNVFLSVIADGSHWQQRLRDLLMESQAIPIKQMGFCADWDSFWCMNH